MSEDPNLIMDVALQAEDVAVDLDRTGRVCTIRQRQGAGTVVQFNRTQHVIPPAWGANVQNIRWLNSNSVAVWPVSISSNKPYCVGIISNTESSTIDVPSPLDILADKEYVVTTYSEEHTRIDVPDNEQSDLISVFAGNPPVKIGRFVDPFVRRLSRELFLEVTCGVVDGEMKGFWFTAYSTNLLWHFSFHDSLSIRTGRLDFPPGDVVAICCDQNTATLVVWEENRLRSRIYRKTMTAIEFQSEMEIFLPRNVVDLVPKLSVGRYGRASGLRGNRLALFEANRAVLLGL
jgi:hypothetical protein